MGRGKKRDPLELEEFEFRTKGGGKPIPYFKDFEPKYEPRKRSQDERIAGYREDGNGGLRVSSRFEPDEYAARREQEERKKRQAEKATLVYRKKEMERENKERMKRKDMRDLEAILIISVVVGAMVLFWRLAPGIASVFDQALFFFGLIFITGFIIINILSVFYDKK